MHRWVLLSVLASVLLSVPATVPLLVQQSAQVSEQQSVRVSDQACRICRIRGKGCFGSHYPRCSSDQAHMGCSCRHSRCQSPHRASASHRCTLHLSASKWVLEWANQMAQELVHQ